MAIAQSAITSALIESLGCSPIGWLDLMEDYDLTGGEVLWVLVAALACQLYSISPDLVVVLKLTDHICSKIKDSLEARFDAARDRGDV